MKLEQLLGFQDYKDGLKVLYAEYNLQEFGYKSEEISEEEYKQDIDEYGYALSDSPEDRRQQIANNKFLKETYDWDLTELWDLDNTLFKFLLPRLYVFYKIDLDESLEQEYEDDGTWKDILEGILDALLNALYTKEGYEEAEHDEVKINKGMYLLGKYIRRLWD